jgi:hypothetical protein
MQKKPQVHFPRAARGFKSASDVFVATIRPASMSQNDDHSLHPVSVSIAAPEATVIPAEIQVVATLLMDSNTHGISIDKMKSMRFDLNCDQVFDAFFHPIPKIKHHI